MSDLIEALLGLFINLFRKGRSRKPILDIRGQQPGDFLQPHQRLTVTLKNNDEAYAIKLEAVYVKDDSSLCIKVGQETAPNSGVYTDSAEPFSSTVWLDLVVPPSQERFFMILFSTRGVRRETRDFISLKVASNRSKSFHRTAKPIILRIAVDASIHARIQ